MLEHTKAICGGMCFLAAAAGSVLAQDVTLTVQGPASANPGDVVTVEVVASVTGLPVGGAIGGYGLDLDLTNGSFLVQTISGATSDPVFGVGVLPGTATSRSLVRAVGGQLPNVSGLNPGVDRSATLSLFTADLTIDPAETAGLLEVSARVPVIGIGGGGVLLFPDASVGTSIIAPTSAGTSLSVVPLTITVEPACLGDTNGDNVISIGDLLTVIAALGTRTTDGAAAGDVDGDTFVNIGDLLDTLSALGTSCS